MPTHYTIKTRESKNEPNIFIKYPFFITIIVFLLTEAVSASKILEASILDVHGLKSTSNLRKYYTKPADYSNLRKYHLKPVDCSKEKVIGGTVGIRPIGQNGIRLEKEIFSGKVIYHNTGHGGAGATLAPGCAREIVNIFAQDYPEDNKNVCVLGAGHIGLMTALELKARFNRVKVIVLADKFPFHNNNNIFDRENPPMTSLIYGGLWLPFGVNGTKKEIVEHSYKFYQQAIEAKIYRGLSYRYAYALPDRDLSMLPQGLIEKEMCEVTFGNNKYLPAARFKTIAMNADILVNDLYTYARSIGIIFKEYKLGSIDDVTNLKYDNIFNCTGYGSKTLFNDKITPSRGKLIYLKPQPEIAYFMSAYRGHDNVTVYPLHDKIAIGLTKEDGVDTLDISEKEIEDLRLKAELFFNDNETSS